MEELLELEAPAAAGSGLAVARDRRGLYIAKAPRALRVQAGDRLVGARIFFEGAPPEVVARLLEGAAGCRVSLCVRRRAPSPGPGTGTGLPVPILTPPRKPPAAPAVELALPKLPKLGKSRSAAEPVPAAPPAPVPARPRAAPPRLTVKEAAGGRAAAMEEPPLKAELPGIARLPAVEVAAPRVTVGLSLPGAAPAAAAAAKEPALRLPRVEVAVPVLPVPEPRSKAGDGAAPGGVRVPSVSIAAPSAAVELVPKAEPRPEAEAPPPGAPARLSLLEAVPSLGIAVPRVDVALALPTGAEGDAASRGAKGLRKLGLEPEPAAPGATGAAKPGAPRLALPRVALALAKLRPGGDGSGRPPAPPGPAAAVAPGPGGAAGAAVKLKVPKLSLAPLGAGAGAGAAGAAPGRRRSPSLPKLPTGPELGVKLPKFGGSSPDLRSGGDPKALRRGGSAGSLSAAGPGAPGALLAPGPSPRFTVPAVGFAAPGGAGGAAKGTGAALKVPLLELAPPRLDAAAAAAAAAAAPGPGRWAGLKLPRFGAGGAGGGRTRPERGGKSVRTLAPSEGRGGDLGLGNGEGKARRRRWVPRVGFSPPPPPSPQRKGGRLRIPGVELCPPGHPQLREGTPKLPLLCGER